MSFAACLELPLSRLFSSSGAGLRLAPSRLGAPYLATRMASQSNSASSSSKPKTRKLLFGTTHVVEPKGEHLATVVWLHGLGDVGASWAEVLEDLPLQNIKWIVPTAPVQPVAVMAGFPCNAWFDVGSLSEEGPNDLEGLDTSAAHVAELLCKESVKVKLGVGGFSQGAATSLFTTVCSIAGSYSDGTPFPCKLDMTVAISGWLPSAKNLQSRFEENPQAVEQAQAHPILMGHGTGDEIVLYKFGEKSAAGLKSLGFTSLLFKTYKGLGHYTNAQEMQDICTFLKEKIHL